MYPTICALIAYIIILNVTKKMMHKYSIKFEDNPMIYYGDYEYYYLPNKTYTNSIKINTTQNNYNYI